MAWMCCMRDKINILKKLKSPEINRKWTHTNSIVLNLDCISWSVRHCNNFLQNKMFNYLKLAITSIVTIF